MFTNLNHFIPGKGFGHCLKEPPGTVKLGEQVSATFVSGLTLLCSEPKSTLISLLQYETKYDYVSSLNATNSPLITRSPEEQSDDRGDLSNCGA